MKVAVDSAVCQGHAQCQDAAPDVFEVRDDGVAHVRTPEIYDPEVIERVFNAANRCPVDAVVISDHSP